MHIPVTVISLSSPSVSGSRGICTLTGPVTGIAVPKLTHTYDANGNLISDATRGIDSIRYNVLNLPETVFFHSGYRLNYTYLADGTKLRETRRRSSFSIGTGSSGILLNATDYIGPYEIEDGVPARLQLPGGHMTLSDNVYHHYIPDYQGNILGVINTATRTMEQYSEYYPYGMPFGRSSGAGLNRRKYSGKELVTFGGYNAMDYHARWRPTLYPMFTTSDPLGEINTNTSLYTYCGGDPVNRIDPSGCIITVMTTDNAYAWQQIQDKWGFYDSNGTAYGGGSEFVDQLTGALEFLMSTPTGNDLVSMIANDERNILIQQSEISGFDNINQSIGWTIGGNEKVPVEGKKFTSNINIALGHELAHVDFNWNHATSVDDNSDIVVMYQDTKYRFKKSELYTTHIENIIRSEHSMPLRTHYITHVQQNSTSVGVFELINRKNKTSLYFNFNGQSKYTKLKKNEIPYKY